MLQIVGIVVVLALVAFLVMRVKQQHSAKAK